MINLVFDTNLMRSNDELHALTCNVSQLLVDLNKYILSSQAENGIKLLIPEVCIEERIRQQYSKYKEHYKEYLNTKKYFNKVNIPKIEEVDCEDYYEQMRKNYTTVLKNYNIGILPMNDNFIINDFFHKAIREIPPFKNAGNSPFKDALINENIIINALKSSDDNFVFFTKNSTDFKSDDSFPINYRIVYLSDTDDVIKVLELIDGYLPNDMDDFKIASDLYIDSIQIQKDIQKAFQQKILESKDELFISPRLEIGEDNKYIFEFEIDEETEQIKINIKILDEEKDYVLELYFIRTNMTFYISSAALKDSNDNYLYEDF